MKNQEVEILAISKNKVTIAFENGIQKEIIVENIDEISEKASFIWLDGDVVLADLVDGKLINIR